MEVRREHDLSRHNTLALPCTASVFVRATDAADIEAAVRLARAERLRVFVLGGGSNLLVSPRIDALVLQPALVLRFEADDAEAADFMVEIVPVLLLDPDSWPDFDELVEKTRDVVREVPDAGAETSRPGTVTRTPRHSAIRHAGAGNAGHSPARRGCFRQNPPRPAPGRPE